MRCRNAAVALANGVRVRQGGVMSLAATTQTPASRAALPVLVALSVCHCLNDTVQSLLPAVYPVLQANYGLTFTQIGFLGFAFHATASILQPVVGLATDKRPVYWLAAAGMVASAAGLLLLAGAASYWVILLAAVSIGLGSAIFHPDSSRTARTASGGRYGFAQSLFQVGGNTGSALGPLLAAFVVLPLGQESIAWFAALALTASFILWHTGRWARAAATRSAKVLGEAPKNPLSPSATRWAVAILITLILTKFIYVALLHNFYTFYLIETFGVSIQTSQLLLFAFLGAVAAGTFAGGPIGDRYGRIAVMWVSILGVLPFTLLLPFVGLTGTAVLSVIIGVLIASAFSAIIVYAQALFPGRVGLVAGLFFGFAFGLGGIAAAALGILADIFGLRALFIACAFVPALGIVTAFLPREDRLTGL